MALISLCVTRRVRTACDRLLVSFMFVAATVLREEAKKGIMRLMIYALWVKFSCPQKESHISERFIDLVQSSPKFPSPVLSSL